MDKEYSFKLEVLKFIIIHVHQTHYEKSDWSRAFNQFTMACELDMINALYYISSVCLKGSGTILIHAERLQISDAPRKQNESI